MHVPELLDDLARLERRWQELRVSTDSLRPGLDRTQVIASLARSGVPAHADLLTWFAWHDGTSELYWYAVPMSVGPLTLEQALEHREEYQPQDESDAAYPPSWLPILGGPSTDHIAMDADTGELLRVDPWDAEAPVRRSGHDLASAVKFFLLVLETVPLDYSSGQAQVRFGDLRAEFQASPLL